MYAIMFKKVGPKKDCPKDLDVYSAGTFIILQSSFPFFHTKKIRLLFLNISL